MFCWNCEKCGRSKVLCECNKIPALKSGEAIVIVNHMDRAFQQGIQEGKQIMKGSIIDLINSLPGRRISHETLIRLIREIK